MEAPSWWHPRSSFQRLRRWLHQRRDRQRRNRQRRDRQRIEDNSCVVTIQYPKMKIKGFSLRDQTEIRPYISFCGIPYARPPIGLLRFQPPYPPPETPDYKYLEARTIKSPCFQCDHKGRPVGSEDCLYLNVAIPTVSHQHLTEKGGNFRSAQLFILQIDCPSTPKNNPALLPVMFYIHGGGFNKGTCEFTEPGTLVARNMVFVDLNYRLGVFGFLNMYSRNCRGNAGMKDIVMALQWVKANISNFGGDPNNVTICGHSAGGSAVNLLMISPMSRGLFNKAIVLGGGIYCPWGYEGDARHVRELFKNYRKGNELAYALVESLKKEDAADLLLMSRQLEREYIEMDPMRISVFLRPSVEFIDDDSTFLPPDIEALMLTAKPVPTIAGIAEREGYMYFRANRSDNLIQQVRKSEKFADFLKQNFRWSNAAAEILSGRVRRMYFPRLKRMDDNALLQSLSIFITDLYHRRFYDNFEIGLGPRPGWAPLYVYRFDYFLGVPINIPETRLVGRRERTIEREAAEHGDDMKFVVGQSWIMEAIEDRIPSNAKPIIRAQALRVMRNMCELWSSFCITGKPKSPSGNMEWLHHSENKPRYLHITDGLTMVNGKLSAGRWDTLNEFCRDASRIRESANNRMNNRQNTVGVSGERDARECFSKTMNFLVRE